SYPDSAGSHGDRLEQDPNNARACSRRTFRRLHEDVEHEFNHPWPACCVSVSGTRPAACIPTRRDDPLSIRLSVPYAGRTIPWMRDCVQGNGVAHIRWTTSGVPSSGTVGPLLWHHLGLLLGLLSALRRDRRLGLAAPLLLATAPRSSRRSRDRGREGLPPRRPGDHLASPGRGVRSLHPCIPARSHRGGPGTGWRADSGPSKPRWGFPIAPRSA